ncbi:integrase [Streptacidiphilus sp. MAP5-52]|uniref:integrase n=1 Tax=Streptacidiphilus sp. MAP5-52 TaxID=3156267 RepID=UPI003512BBB3
MTIDDLLASPPAVSLAVANAALGIGRTVGYDLARRGKYPARVYRVGNGFRVATVEVCALLGFDYQQKAPLKSQPQSRAA